MNNLTQSHRQKNITGENNNAQNPSTSPQKDLGKNTPRFDRKNKYSRAKSEKNIDKDGKSDYDGEKSIAPSIEFTDIDIRAKEYLDGVLKRGVLNDLKSSDVIGTPLELIIAPLKDAINRMAARYYDSKDTLDMSTRQRMINSIAMFEAMIKKIRSEYNGGNPDYYRRTLGDTIFRERAREGSALMGSMHQRNREIADRANGVTKGTATEIRDAYDGLSSRAEKLLREIQNANEKHSADKQSASFVARNPNAPESLKELGNIDTPLDRLTKVPVVRLRKSEQSIQQFGKTLGVPVHFVDGRDAGFSGVFTHNGEIFINRKGNVPVRDIFVHEFVHWLKASKYNSGMYDALVAAIEGQNGPISEARTERYAKGIFDGENMTTEEISKSYITSDNLYLSEVKVLEAIPWGKVFYSKSKNSSA